MPTGDEFFTIINSGLDARVLAEGNGWLVAKLLPGIYDVVTDGTNIAMMNASAFLQQQHPGKRFFVWETSQLDDGRYATTMAVDDTKKEPP